MNARKSVCIILKIIAISYCYLLCLKHIILLLDHLIKILLFYLYTEIFLFLVSGSSLNVALMLHDYILICKF